MVGLLGQALNREGDALRRTGNLCRPYRRDRGDADTAVAIPSFLAKNLAQIARPECLTTKLRTLGPRKPYP